MRSSVRPLVSGTRSRTKARKPRVRTPKNQNAIPTRSGSPGLPTTRGNSSVIRRFAPQLAAVAIAAARARMLPGSTSDRSSHASGPAEIAKNAM